MKIHRCPKCKGEFAFDGAVSARVCPFCRNPIEKIPDEIELSICAPMYCEEGVVVEFVERCARAASQCTTDFEILIVDDGSRDGTWDKIESLAKHNPFLRAVRHSRNFGLQAAVTSALERSRGRATVIIDGDLEDPPELIPSLFKEWRGGAEIVYTVKEARKVGFLKGLLFRSFHWLFTHLASPPMPSQSGLFCLIDRKIVDSLNKMPERVRYVPGLRSWVGFRQKEVRYSRSSRYDSIPRQSLLKLFQMATVALTSFSSAPLQIGLGIGFAAMFLSLIGIIVIICIRIFTDRAVPGWATYTSLLVGLAGFISFYISVIGCYLGHVYLEVKRRPLSIVEKEI